MADIFYPGVTWKDVNEVIITEHHVIYIINIFIVIGNYHIYAISTHRHPPQRENLVLRLQDGYLVT